MKGVAMWVKNKLQPLLELDPGQNGESQNEGQYKWH